MSFGVYPDRYLRYNTQQTKRVAVAVQIPGLDLLSSTPIYERIRYGMPNLLYGQPSIVYGGLRQIAGNRDILSLEGSSLTIGQKVEPEQGRAAVSLMTLSFIDKDGYMSQAISPGVLIPEILGAPVRIYFGYADTGFPEDYFTTFRGFVTGTTSDPGTVTLQLSDASLKRRQKIARPGKTTLATSVSNSATAIPLTTTSGFPQRINDAFGADDPSVRTYIKVDDEWMEYALGGISVNTVNVSSRGARGTSAVAHTSGAPVTSGIQLQGPAMLLALKLMCSGFDGPFLKNAPLYAIRSTGTPTLGDQPKAIVLPLNKDAVQDYGLAIGDHFGIGNSSNSNDLSGKIVAFGDWEDLSNRVIYTDQTFNPEGPGTPALLTVRSQFDTLPTVMGMKIESSYVDISAHVKTNANFTSQDIYQFFFQKEETGKTFLESEIYSPEGAYALTKYGQLSVNMTLPPLASQKLIFLDKDNVLNPESISFTRNINSRRFFNDIVYQLDADDSGKFFSVVRLLDTDSLNVIGVASSLPINSLGLKSTLSGGVIANRRGRFLLTRYKQAAFEINVKTNWEAGSLIETGDIVALVDEGNLQITNITSGKRNLGTALFEVIDRKVDIKSGNVSLQLLSNVGFDLSDRYAVITPSSTITSYTAGRGVTITESYGSIFPANEPKKWVDYVGLRVIIHDYYWTRSEEAVFLGFDSANDHLMLLSPSSLGIAVMPGDIVDVAPYSTSTDPRFEEAYKVIHAFVDKTDVVTAGPASTTSFTVASANPLYYFVGAPVMIHNPSYSRMSNEVKILSIVGNLITTDKDLGLTPAVGEQVELLGFPDHRGPFRMI